jgi:4a-hydroxytetrahydrobiopterin dehydratase
MSTETAADLRQKHCRPCEGGVPPMSNDEVAAQLKAIPHWQLSQDGKRIHREWTAKDFLAGIEFFQQVAKVAEAEQHHPDLHLEGYRKVRIELSTHAIGGLSENDFILAAKIDALPIQEKKTK